ncbi:MAG TPA: UDP-glucose/GDP-mannose dehydrogenase family protein, partial [Cryomorphaceae bacterium]|nr:UDP-glucose/GDP-mannose dehydrogenase family protein [Cryomorphaceae bacterium]
SLIHKVKQYYGDDLEGKTFALWGLAFKPDTDDIREAPALYMIRELLLAKAKVVAFDPEAMENVKTVHGDTIEYAENMYSALKDADALLIATEWSVFRSPDFEKVSEGLKKKVIFDGRNLFEPAEMKQLGYHYESIGREKITS